jgi:cold shock protein
MIEHLIGLGSTALEIGAKVSPIFSVISGVAGWVSRKQILDELQRTRQSVERIADGIDYFRGASNIVLNSDAKPVDYRRVNHLLVPARKALKTDIVASAFLPTPDVMKSQFQQNIWQTLHDVSPLSKADLNRGPEWVPFVFEHSNELWVAWQKKRALAPLGLVDFKTEAKEWIRVPRPVGTVKSFNAIKRYGFLKPDDGGPDVFVHMTTIEEAGLKTISEGERFSYEIEPGHKGKGVQAKNLLIMLDN